MSKRKTSFIFKQWTNDNVDTRNYQELDSLRKAISSQSDENPFRCGPNPYKDSITVIWKKKDNKLVLRSKIISSMYVRYIHSACHRTKNMRTKNVNCKNALFRADSNFHTKKWHSTQKIKSKDQIIKSGGP